MQRIRTDTALNWATNNPILRRGEQGFDNTNRILKIGNGITPWADLPAVQDQALQTANWRTDGNSAGNSPMFLGRVDNAALQFRTNNTPHATLNADGQLVLNPTLANHTVNNTFQLHIGRTQGTNNNIGLSVQLDTIMGHFYANKADNAMKFGQLHNGVIAPVAQYRYGHDFRGWQHRFFTAISQSVGATYLNLQSNTEWGWLVGNTNHPSMGTGGFGLYHQPSDSFALTVNSGTRFIGVGQNLAATARLHVNHTNGHQQFRLQQPYTPTSSADSNGLPGSIAWDSNNIYFKTPTGWLRCVGSTF